MTSCSNRVMMASLSADDTGVKNTPNAYAPAFFPSLDLPPGLGLMLESPGLRFLLSDILLRLDAASFANAELVSKQWRDLFLHERLWRARLLETAAPLGSYQRHLVVHRSPEFQAALSISASTAYTTETCESSRLFRRLCWRLEGGGLSREWTRPKRGKLKPFKVRRVSNARIVRDLKICGDVIAFATGTAIHLGSRQLTTAQQQSSDDADSSSGSECDNTLRIDVDHELDGHRREVIVFDLDQRTDLLASAGRDRRITFWRISSAEQLARVDEAHARLITCIKLKKSSMASSSRDHSVKVWQLGPAADFTYQVIQTLAEHAHSVWAVDLNDSFLASGGQDKKVRIWRKTRAQSEDGTREGEHWEKQCEMEDHHAGIRNLLLLRGQPHLCLTGDIYGDLRVWNAIERRLQYQVPEQDDTSWFSHSGAVAAISQCAQDQRGGPTGDFLAVAFGSHRVVLYDSSRAEQRLDVCRVIQLEPLVGTAILRTVIATPVEIYLSTFSGKHGIIVLDIWDEDDEE